MALGEAANMQVTVRQAVKAAMPKSLFVMYMMLAGLMCFYIKTCFFKSYHERLV